MLSIKKTVTKLGSVLLVISMCALPIGNTKVVAADNTILVEGENPYYTNFTPDHLHTKDSALSQGDFLCLKMPAGTTAPAEGYIVSYKVNVSEGGYYQFDVTSLPYNAGSPYDIKVNNGDFVHVDGTNAKQYDVVSSTIYKNTFYKYHMNPISLNQGENIISFRVTETRSMDKRFFFYLDCFSLKKVPWGIQSISFDASVGVYQEHENINATVHFYGKDIKDNEMGYSVIDFWSAEIKKGTFIVPQGQDQAVLNLGQLPKGHYTVYIKITGTDKTLADSFAVVTPMDERSNVADSPFAADTGLSWLTPLNKANNYASVIKLAGIKWVRERFRWSTSNPAAGVYDYNTGNYDAFYKAISDQGIKILDMFSSSPSWTHTNSSDKLSGDLIAAYTFGKESGSHYGGEIPAWEMWNEPELTSTNDNESADRMAAYIKAISIGYRDANPSTLVSLPGLAYPPANYAELLLQNQVMDYVDIYNFHDHTGYNEKDTVIKIPEIFKQHLNLLERYNAQDKPVWLSEAGIYTPFDAEATEPTHTQQVRQADYLVTSTVTSLANGVDKHFWFVLPYYVENGRSLGTFSQANTPYAAYAAEAAMTEALGEAKYIGRMNGLPAAATAQIFKDGTDSVAVFWSEAPAEITLPLTQNTAVLTNIMGLKKTITPVNGTYSIQIGPEPLYLRITGDFPASLIQNKAVNNESKDISLSQAQRIILEQKYPGGVSIKSKVEGYKLPKEGSTAITVEVNNLNNTTMKGVIQGETFGGWKLTQESQEITVEPYKTAKLTFYISAQDSVKLNTTSAVKFTGIFDGQKTSDSISMVSLSGQEIVTVSSLIPGSDDPSKWIGNISANGNTSITPGKESGSVRFAFSFNGGSRWAYPELFMPEGTNFNGTKGLALWINPESDFTGNTVLRVIVYEKNGSVYFTSAGFNLKKGWQQLQIPWSDITFSPLGKIDDNFHLDTDMIYRIEVGINPDADNPPAYTIKDFGVYTGNEDNLYSTLGDIISQKGVANIAVCKKAIDINPDTINVRVDGSVMSSTYDEASGMITINTDNLSAGSHTLSIQFLYRDGKGCLKSLSFIVDKTPPETNINVEGKLNNGWYSTDATVTLNAVDDMSGVDKIEYRLGDSGEWNVYKGPFALQQDGIYTIQYHSTDKAGNAESIKQKTVQIDKTAPSTSATLSGTLRGKGTYNSNVVVNLEAIDEQGGSGGVKTEYSFDNTNWLQYSGPVTVANDGTINLNFRSMDIAGNVENIKTITITISKTPDVLTLELIDKINGFNLEKGAQKSLTSKLDNIYKAILNDNKTSSVNQLKAFINEVKAQSGKKLTTEQADNLEAYTNKIITAINSELPTN